MVMLRDGRVVGERSVAETEPRGADPADRGPRAVTACSSGRRAPASGPAASASGVTIGDVGPRRLSRPSRRGGRAWSGCAAPGRRRVGRALFGLAPATGGTDPARRRQPIARPSAPRRSALGIGLVARRPRRGSVAPGLSIRENLFLNPAAAGRRLFVSGAGRAESRAARELGERVGLRPERPRRCRSSALSGGNQQKVVVGRWLQLGPELRSLEDPTAGVDVGAKAEIYRLFDVVLAARAAIILVSTDFEEVANVCHRALVFQRGQVAAELPGDDLSRRAILLAAASASVAAGPPGSTACSPADRPRSSRPRSSWRRSAAASAIGALLPVYGLPILTVLLDRCLLAPAARPFPTAAQRRARSSATRRSSRSWRWRRWCR